MALKLIFNPISGKFDYIDVSASGSSTGYTYYTIPAATTVTIPDGFENLCTSVLTIDGTLVTAGRTTVIG